MTLNTSPFASPDAEHEAIHQKLLMLVVLEKKILERFEALKIERLIEEQTKLYDTTIGWLARSMQVRHHQSETPHAFKAALRADLISAKLGIL